MNKELREEVRQRYAQAITSQEKSCCSVNKGCCSDTKSASEFAAGIKQELYPAHTREGVDEELVLASFGCGNPTALEQLKPGEVVLDLGSGAGLDVLISAKRVGPSGKVYGLDMTDEMLAAAQANLAKSDLNNVEFLKGYLEEIPLPDNTVDVIISNCVINLSSDKDLALGEALRVLKPGGRFAVADIVVRRALPGRIQEDMLSWAGCIAGALQHDEYITKLARAGFENITIQVTKEYELPSELVERFFPVLTAEEIESLHGSIISAFVRATKPLTEGAEAMKANSAELLREQVRILERYLGFMGKSEMSCCGVTLAQCHALVEIGRAGRLSLSSLAEILNLDLSTVSRTVDGLVKSKQAVRETDPENRRFVQISLTEEGHKIYLNIEEKMNKYFTEIFAALPEDKKVQVLESLELLLMALQKSNCCGGGSCEI